MLIDWLLELKDSIDKHGIRMGVVITLYALFRKERRNIRLDQRDADVFHNQRVIMEKLGVVDQWRGQTSPFQNEEVRQLRKLYSSSQAVLNQVYQQRRVIKMNQQNINFTTLAPGIIAVLKLVFQSFGIEIPDEHINSMVNGAAALYAVIAVIMSHRKPNGGTLNVPTQSTADSGPAV